MATIFRGRFDCKVDQKGRLNLPSAYRSTLPKKESTLVITNSQYQKQRCLDVYTLKEWEKLEAKIAKMPSLKREVQAYQRFYISGGHTIDVDANQRVLVPQSLRQYANIKDQIVCVGMGHKFEIWPAQIWQKLHEGMVDQFEDILGAVADLEGGLD